MNIKIQILSLATLVFLTSVTPLRAEEPPASYPLTKCVISDEKLGDHGKPVKVTSEDTDVYLCCKMCKKDFDKDPKKYTKIVKDAAAAKK